MKVIIPPLSFVSINMLVKDFMVFGQFECNLLRTPLGVKQMTGLLGAITPRTSITDQSPLNSYPSKKYINYIVIVVKMNAVSFCIIFLSWDFFNKIKSYLLSVLIFNAIT